MKHNTRKLFSLVLAVLMVLAVVPASAFATTAAASANALPNAEANLLLKLSSMNGDAVVYKADDGITVTDMAPNKNGGRAKDAGVTSPTELEKQGIYRIGSNSNMSYIGVKTNLPMDETAKYTVRFSVKISEYNLATENSNCDKENPNYLRENVSFGFNDGTAAGQGPHLLIKADGGKGAVNTHSAGVNSNNQGKYPAATDVPLAGATPWWQVDADADGYVTWTLTVNRGIMTAYQGSTKICSWNINASTLVTDSSGIAAPNVGTFENLALSTGLVNITSQGTSYMVAKEHDKNGKPLDANSYAPGAYVKNIEVYNCAYQLNEAGEWVDPATLPPPQTEIFFENEEGTELADTRKELVDGVYTIEAFPTVESEKIVYWTEKKTGAIVTAPYICFEGTTFVAHEAEVGSTRIVGVQRTNETVDDTAGLRLIGATWSLLGEAVGVEIRMTSIKSGENTPSTAEDRLETSTVYRGINATVNGSLKSYTAQELGAYYLLVIDIPNVSTVGQVDFEVVTFKTVNGVDVKTDAVTFSFVDGAFTTEATPLS